MRTQDKRTELPRGWTHTQALRYGAHVMGLRGAASLRRRLGEEAYREYMRAIARRGREADKARYASEEAYKRELQRRMAIARAKRRQQEASPLVRALRRLARAQLRLLQEARDRQRMGERAYRRLKQRAGAAGARKRWGKTNETENAGSLAITADHDGRADRGKLATGTTGAQPE